MQTYPRRILITGASGWLGKRLTRVIAQRSLDLDLLREFQPGIAIRSMILPNEDAAELQALGVEVFRGDLRSPVDCEDFLRDAAGGLLLHTAGVIHPQRVKEFYEVNVNGTRNLLNAAISSKVKRAVIVSSNSPIGLNPDSGHLFDETSPYHPYMNYGRSKMQMELLVKEIEKSGNLETVIIRPPWFYGTDQPPRQTLFFSMIRAGKAPIVGSGNNLRSMAYIDNLCEGLLLAGFTERARGQTYWIADRRPYSMNEIVDTVERLLETEFRFPVAHKRLRLPNLASEVAVLLDATLQSVGFYNQKIHVLSELNKDIACSVSKATIELGYSPKVSLEEGMRRSIASCVERGIQI
jgi:nucleoside-diphosphate-sugar epimerase